MAKTTSKTTSLSLGDHFANEHGDSEHGASDHGANEHGDRAQALKAALIEGEKSGTPHPFDFDGFKARKRAARDQAGG